MDNHESNKVENMIKKLYSFASMCMSLFLFFNTEVYAETNESDLQTKLTSIRTLHAHFKQDIQAKKRRVGTSSGTMALSRPGLFRWQTNQPSAQLVVADGRHIWIYDKELEQVSVKKQTSSLGGTAALFLSEDPAAVTRDFEVSKIADEPETIFSLKARSVKANFEKVQLVFNKQALHTITLYDQLGQRTTITLSQVQTNQKLASKLFHFTVPKGVDVVQQ